MFSLFSTVSVQKAKNISPVTLAFVGDAVYSLYVREKLVLSTDFGTGTLQKLTSSEVSAHGQSELLEKVQPLFTEEENDISRGAETPKRTLKVKMQALPNTTAQRASRRYSAIYILRDSTTEYRLCCPGNPNNSGEEIEDRRA